MASVVGTPSGLRILAAHLAPIQALATAETADGHGLILSAGGDDLVRSWDAMTGEELGFTGAGGAVVKGLAVVPVGDGHVVVCVNARGLHRWELATGQPWGEPVRRTDPWLRRSGIGAVAVLTVDGAPVVVGGGPDGRVRRWDLLTGEPIGSPSAGHDGEVYGVGWLRLGDDRMVIVSGGRDGTVRRWDALTGEPVGAPVAHRAPVVAVACVAVRDVGDVVASQTAGGTIHRWDAGTGEPVGSPMSLDGRGLAGRGLAASADGSVLWSIGFNGALWRWDLTRTGPVAEPWSDRVATVNAIAVVPTAGGPGGPVLVTGTEKGRLQRWDAAGHPIGEASVGHPAGVADLVAVPATALLVSQGRDGARCWNADTGELVGPHEAMPAGYGLAVSSLPDGRVLLATGLPEGIARYDVLGNRELGWSPDPGDVEIQDVAAGALPDGTRFVAGAGDDGLVYRVDAVTGQSLGRPLRGLDGQATAVAVATLPDGVVIVAGAGEDQTIRRWNAVTGEPFGDALTGHRAWVVGLAIIPVPAGPVVLVSVDDDGEVRRWDATSGEPFGEPFAAGGGEISGLRLTVAGTVQPPQLVTAGSDRTVRRWNAISGQLLQEVPNATCGAVVTLPDGRGLLAVGGEDGTISIEPLSSVDPL